MIALHELEPLKSAPFSLGLELEYQPWFSQQTRTPSVRQMRKDGGPQGAEAAVVARIY